MFTSFITRIYGVLDRNRTGIFCLEDRGVNLYTTKTNGEPPEIRTQNVSYVTDLQSACFANLHRDSFMAVLKGIEPSSFGRQPNIITNVLQNQMETSTGIEPSNPAVKEQCVKPLHQLVIWRERKELNFHYLINSQPFYHWTTFPYGADDRNRTCNLLLTRQLLYLLSYDSI